MNLITFECKKVFKSNLISKLQKHDINSWNTLKPCVHENILLIKYCGITYWLNMDDIINGKICDFQKIDGIQQYSAVVPMPINSIMLVLSRDCKCCYLHKLLDKNNLNSTKKVSTFRLFYNNEFEVFTKPLFEYDRSFPNYCYSMN